MKAVLQNPYRILGLPANTSERQIQKQISIIKRYAEVGKSKTFEYDFNFLGPINRDLDAIEKASSKLEQIHNKLHQSLFWFINHSRIDSIAFNHMINGNDVKASEIWYKSLKNTFTICNFTASITVSNQYL